MENSGEPTIHIIFPQILTLLARTQHVLLSNITFFVIFAVLDVSLAVNLSINCSFYIYICSFITFLSYYSKTAFLDCLHKIIIRQFLVFSTKIFCLIPLSRLIWVPVSF